MRRHTNHDSKATTDSKNGSKYFRSLSEFVRYVVHIDIKGVMQLHSVICIFIGLGTLLLPHRFYSSSSGYNHFAHEFVRLYGCLTLGIGYLVWNTKDIRDGRLIRALTETFALSYGLQALAMLRAQISNPDGHSFFHWFILFLFVCVSGLYAYSRFAKKIKDYELPGFNRGE
jgi:hypothetical protein